MSQVYQLRTAAGSVIGLLDVRCNEKEIEVVNIQIHPDYQGRGTGTAILRKILDDGATRGVPVTLRVLKTNEDARRLYQRLGFIDDGETQTHCLLRATSHLNKSCEQ